MIQVGRTKSGWLVEVSDEEMEAIERVMVAGALPDNITKWLYIANEIESWPARLRWLANSIDEKIEKGKSE